MKFRCKITDSSYIQRFIHAFHVISKFSRQCSIRISASGLFLIVFEESGERQPVAWCKIDREQFFDEFNLCGVSERHNEICLKVSTHVVLKILSPSKAQQLVNRHLKISLTNRKVPCLTFEITSDQTPSRICLHDVPVEVIARKDWVDIAPPNITLDPQVSITIPELDHFESVWDKVKSMSRHIVLLANGRGSLSLRIETELSDVTSHFRDLPVVVSEENEDLDEFVKGRIKCSKFMLLKDLYQTSPVKIVLHIRNRRYVMLDVFYDDIVLHYIVPAVKK